MGPISWSLVNREEKKYQQQNSKPFLVGGFDPIEKY